MVNYKTLKPYLHRDIEDWGGYTSDDYKSFSRKYRNLLKRLCKEKGYELVWFHDNHYEFTCMFKSGEKYIYFSISDVRYWKNEWFNQILVRYAINEKDYGGWHSVNDYTTLPELESKLESMFSREPRLNG